MDNNGGESVGDQGTGWFQVKKKHRSSSKFSLQSWVGGISGRNGSNSRYKHSQTNETNRNVQYLNNGVSKRSFEHSESNPPLVSGDSSVGTKSLSLEEVSRVENFGGVGIKFSAIRDDIDNDLGIHRRAQVEDDNDQKDSNEESVNKEVTHIEEVKEVNGESLTANSSFVDSSNPNLVEKNPETVSVGDELKILEKRPLSSSDIASSSQSTNVLGESDSVESKERFRQRLWCYLFENLNRSVDELYLLCELECDLEQMKEAILVLEEAASDFKELTSRVEEFESMKKSSPKLSNGSAPINLKTDHRRPHALSWEVRRMTTSAHKAEILSSSLEAFKKIQRERASLQQAYDASVLLNLESSESFKHSPCTVTDEVHSEKHLETEPDELNRTPNEHEHKLSPNDNSEEEKMVPKKVKPEDHSKRQISQSEPHREKEKEKPKRGSSDSWKSMDAWKEKRNWRDILSSPFRGSSRVSHSPGMSRRSAERARMLHDKLMSPEKKKKTAVDLKKEAEEKHARATRIRSELENERAQKLQRTSEKLSRVSEFQADRSLKLRQGMYARQRRSESRHEAFLAQVVKRAGDESSKVNEVRFITSLNEENKKLILRQKLHDSEVRRAEKLQVMKSKQKEDTAREEAVLERRKLIEAEKLQRLAETQRRKEEAQIRREEERKASSAAREARTLEQLRRKEERAKAQQEEAELLAQKLAEKLSESEQRRKFYLEQIRERASMDFRDQSSPLLRRSANKECQGRSNNAGGDDNQASNSNSSGLGDSNLVTSNIGLQHSMKRRIKRIRQRLMALKYEFPETPVGAENVGIGYRTAMGTARVRIGRWLQELQRLRQARKEGAASIGLITAEMIKYLEGKDAELQASRQAGLIDFIASALPASHTSKPEACQVTIHLLKLLKVILSLPANRSYFLGQNLLPPVIPMLSASLENYIKIAASLNLPGNTNLSSSKTSAENFESITEVLDGFLWTVTTIIGHINSEEQQIQMRDSLLELLTAYQVIHRLRDLFALYDRPQVEGSPFPSSILLSIYLLVVLTSGPELNCLIDWESLQHEKPTEVKFAENDENLVLESQPEDSTKSVSPQKEEKNMVDENILNVDQPVAFLLSAISETGLVSLLSVLTAVLLQANNRLSSDQGSYALPSNFEEVATGVLKVLNNLALLDLKFLQRMLSRPDLKMEFFHLLSFLLFHCNSKWKAANDQVGMLLLESLSLLGHFALFHPGNRAVLRWGKTPTILHKICDLPFVFFSDPELMPSLASTLVAACYGCNQNKGVVQQEISTDMLLSLLRSCRNTPTECELLKRAAGQPSKPKSQTSRNSRVSSVKSGVKNGKVRNQRDCKMAKSNQEMDPRPSSETSSMMLHSRLSLGFIDMAEQFFVITEQV